MDPAAALVWKEWRQTCHGAQLPVLDLGSQGFWVFNMLGSCLGEVSRHSLSGAAHCIRRRLSQNDRCRIVKGIESYSERGNDSLHKEQENVQVDKKRHKVCVF